MAIWDSLILCGSGMVICIGVAILIEIREILLSFSFEKCILFFSDAPDVDLERVIVTARRIFDTTKPSMYARQFSRADNEPLDEDSPVRPDTRQSLHTPVHFLTSHDTPSNIIMNLPP